MTEAETLHTVPSPTGLLRACLDATFEVFLCIVFLYKLHPLVPWVTSYLYSGWKERPTFLSDVLHLLWWWDLTSGLGCLQRILGRGGGRESPGGTLS